MTQEEKELLLKDLCARLPYGVKYQDRIEGGIHILSLGIILHYERFIPYLRPMSSMTEEEKKEYEKVCELDTEILANHPMNGEPFPALYNSQDWLNKNHFDYRGLIEKGLALVAPEGMYNDKE
jgi:hypothetical protein